MSEKNGFLRLKDENGLLSRMEVGLMTDSVVSEKFFEVKLVKSRGELMKRDEEMGLLDFSVGEG